MNSDAALVEAIRSGEAHPWGEVFDRHRASVWYVAMSITQDSADSDEVVRTTFLKAVETLDRLRDPDKLRPWLLSIARAEALERVRRVPASASGRSEPSEVAAANGDTDLRRDEIAELVTSAYDALEPRDRIALELVELRGLSGEDLAAVLGVSRADAEALVHDAKSRFTRSVESTIVAHAGRGDCGELDGLLGACHGALAPPLRKRVGRHIASCPTCAGTRDREITSAALLSVLPLPAMPTAGSASHRPAPPLRLATKLAAVVVTVAVAAIGVVAASIIVLEESRGSETPAQAAVMPRTEPDAEPDAWCTTAAELAAIDEPASAAPEAIEDHLRAVSDLAQVLAAGPQATATVAEYAAAVDELVADEAWTRGPVSGDPELAELRDAVLGDLAEQCPTS